MTRRIPLIVSLCLVLAASLAPASAEHMNVEDPNDTTGPLDLKLIKVDGGERPRFNIRTYNRWKASSIWDRGYFIVWLDTFGNPTFDYYVLLRSNGWGMHGSAWRDYADDRDDRYVARAKTWKPTRRRVVTRAPTEEMRIGAKRTFFRWQVQTLFTSDKCSSVCFDVAPDTEPMIEPFVPEP